MTGMELAWSTPPPPDTGVYVGIKKTVTEDQAPLWERTRMWCGVAQADP